MERGMDAHMEVESSSVVNESSIGQTTSLSELKEALLLSYLQCSELGLIYSANWAAELANSLDAPVCNLPSVPHSPLFVQEYPLYAYGKSLYDIKEYRRAAHALRNAKSNEGFFLRCYSLFMAGEKTKEDNEVEVSGLGEEEPVSNPELLTLKQELADRADQGQLDGFGYYLYGVVLRELGVKAEAREKLLKSCELAPLLWSSWQELTKLCESREMLYKLPLPSHWMKDFFVAACSLELMLTTDALTYFTHLSKTGFASSSYISTQLALVYYHMKDFEQSSTLFTDLRKTEPYQLQSIDVFSHVLFVMRKTAELTRLANDVDDIDRYRPETCSVIGNFYSLLGDHDKAVVYFKRAVRLNKKDHTAWILLGHEYLELKNHSMAIEAYTRALETNRQDFKSYYGLGHAYEVLRMPFFALNYYKMAHNLQPSDSRVLYALGYCYDQLEQNELAKKCYKRAIAFHDQEGVAIIKLAKLHIRLSEEDEAAKLYLKFVTQAEMSQVGTHQPEEQGPAHLFLAHYHMKQNHFAEAEVHAHKASEFVMSREEGKSLLQEIHKRRAATGDTVDLALSALADLNQEVSPISSDK